MEITKAIIARAAETRALLEKRTRDSGAEFWCLVDGRPDWAQELVRDAHGDFGPEDLRYVMIKDALDAIEAAEPGDDSTDIDPDAAGMVDIMNADLCAWLASNVNRIGYCDEAAEECGTPTGIIAMIQLGQAAEAREVIDLVAEGLAASLESDDEAADA